MDRKLGRRGLMAWVGRASSIAVLAPLGKIIPEVQAIGVDTPRVQLPGADANDPALRKAIASVRATREWSDLRSALVSDAPTAHATARGGEQLITFSLWDMSPAAVQARKFGGFQLLDTVIFGVDGKDVRAVQIGHPDADGRHSTWRDARDGTLRVVDPKPDVDDEIQHARAESEARSMQLKQRVRPEMGPATAGGKLASPQADGCDCYPSRFYCGQWYTVPGRFVEGCPALCEVGCYFLGVNALVCLAICYAGCWVPGYTSCGGYYCGPCLV